MFPVYFCKSSNTVINQSKTCAIYQFTNNGPSPVAGVTNGISCDFAGTPYANIASIGQTKTTGCVIAGSLTPQSGVSITFVSNCTS